MNDEKKKSPKNSIFPNQKSDKNENPLINRKSLKVQFNVTSNKNNIKSFLEKNNQINNKQNQKSFNNQTNKFFKNPKTKDGLINGVQSCCYVPPINYNYKCKEIKKPINYGRRIQKIDSKPCNHYLIGDDNCERCCKLISFDNEIFSLHCAWHHQILSCCVCENTISESNQKNFKGKNYCLNCFNKLKGLHASNMITKHK